MSLQEKLDNMRKQFESTAPSEVLKIMHRATDELLKSGIMEGVLKEGDDLPAFSLSDHNGNLISSSEILHNGPLVISFYRGVW